MTSPARNVDPVQSRGDGWAWRTQSPGGYFVLDDLELFTGPARTIA